MGHRRDFYDPFDALKIMQTQLREERLKELIIFFS
jgi:hypothetical protein